MQGVVVGRGYVIVGGKVVEVRDRQRLASVVKSIQEAGGVIGTILWVKPGVDLQATYVGTIPSQNKPIVAISGCREPKKLLGLVSLVQVDIDPEFVERVWGAGEVDRRINGLMLQCLIYGMSNGEEATFKQAVAEAVKTMEGVVMFGVMNGGQSE
ncbi:MAG: hypothetical protein HFACDABA_00583 [Anaerolineales bacterium]|nr:hypothetical protein [Anaerolineales bacterium]